MSTFTSSQIAPIPLANKGDIAVHDGSKIVALPVGSDGYFLKADSGAPEGLSWDVASGGSGQDHHASWYNIISSQTLVVSSRKQMIVHGEFINDGILELEGSLILED